jgi:rhomboid protease GluP
MVPNIDQAAHLGGFVAGLVGGLIMAGPLKEQSATRRVVRPIMVACMGIAAISAAISILSFPVGYISKDDYFRAKSDLVLVEKRALEKYNEASRLSQQNRITEEQFADRIEREILPPWREIRLRLADFKELPKELQEEHRLLLAYLKSREDCWDLFARSIRTNDMKLHDKAMEESERTQKILDALAKLQPR